MNFLDLCDRVKREFGISLGIRLFTVQNVTGELARICDCVNDAWLEIQRIHPDWEWLRSSVSFETTEGIGEYTATDAGATDFGMWSRNTFRCYPTATGTRGEMFMPFNDYELFRNVWLYGANRAIKSRPLEFSITPSKALIIGPLPDYQGWTIVGDYFKCPTTLSADADIPILPEKFHSAIACRAAMLYGGEVDKYRQDIVERNRRRYNELKAEMEFDQLPEMLGASTLA